MDNLLSKFLWGQLQTMGLFMEKQFTLVDLKANSSLLDLYDRWLDESIAVLEQNHYLTKEGDLYTVIDTTPIDMSILWVEWDQQKGKWLADPDLKAQVVLMEAALRVLPEILTGKVKATDILFPKSSMNLVEGMYKQNKISDYFNEIIANTIVAFIKERLKQDSSAQFRFIEVGAGTGGTSFTVFHKLIPYREHIQEYCYTDISRAFLMFAEKKYGPENPYLTYKIFDVEKTITEQEIGSGEYDIAIATNVLHATKNMRQTLRNVKTVLKKNGLILIHEMSKNTLGIHLTFGLLEGWWLYEDPEIRIPGCPALYPESWQKVLESEGFQSVIFPAKKDHDLGQQIIVAQSDGVVWQKLQLKPKVLLAKPQVTPIKQEDLKKTIKQDIKTALGKRQESSKSLKTERIIEITDQMVKDYIQENVIEKLSESLKVDSTKVDVDGLFADYGVDSITGIYLIQMINQTLMIELKTTDLFDYSSVNQLTAYILSQYKDVVIATLGQNLKQVNNKIDLIHENKRSLPVYSSPKHFQPRISPKVVTKKVMENKGENVKSLKTERIIEITDQMVKDYIQENVIEKLSESLKVDSTKVDVDGLFADYGVDSITGIYLIQMINQTLMIELKTTDLFDYSSVNQLTAYILSQYKNVVIATLGQNLKQVNNKIDLIHQNKRSLPVYSSPKHFQSRISPKVDMKRTADNIAHNRNLIQKEPIAIIGMSGRFPKSKNVNELWNNLASGRDLVEEATRWGDLSKFNPDGASLCKNGGFLDDIDKFDPLFFNISGIEATYMDPQQRIFLEESWKALEDAGCAGTGIEGRLCGVYVGYNIGDYGSLIGKTSPAQGMWGNASSIIPARLAYYLNLKGPAITIDTACSSSLVAVHLACQGLWARETEIALAGGVLIQCTPELIITAGKAGMLSATGRCYTFDERADGFVPGEGVGVVVLKRLDDAIADGDHIYGVISGTGLNQDGTTNGITAPSAISQEQLERYVYDTFNINPEQIQMVETHGTGTILGDPIEYQALTKAFRNYTNKEEYCAIGALKTNIGHTLAASGVAGLIKVLLSIQHKQIPPSLHFQKGNPHIQFKGSPFYVNISLRDWEVEPNVKRCAVLSSFGFSGTNVHMAIEEAPTVAIKHSEKPGYLIVLSAHTSDQLHQQVEQLVEFCENRNIPVDCGNMSYTLFFGRKHFNHRLACVVRNQDELIKLLRKWLEKGKVSQIYLSNLSDKEHREQSSIKQYGNECIQNCLDTDNSNDYLEHLSAIAELYIQGYGLEFKKLFSDEQYSRISLPTYPFARERYWVPMNNIPGDNTKSKAIAAAIHPLVHQNISTLSEQQYSSTLTGEEFFLKDHIVKGQSILPGVAYLEMARAAVEAAAGITEDNKTGIKLKNVVWARPIAVGTDPVQVRIGIFPEENGEIAYEIYSEPKGAETEPIVHSQGSAELISYTEDPIIDIKEIQSQCNQSQLSPDQCYAFYKATGIDYGPGHKGIENVYIGQDCVLAKLSLPLSVSETIDQYVLHPSLMDSAFQSQLGLMLGMIGSLDNSADNKIPLKPTLPFALNGLDIYHRCTPGMWTYIRSSKGSKVGDKLQKMDIDLSDEQGNVCVRMKELVSRVLEGEISAESPATIGTVILEPVWQEQTIGKETTVSEYSQHLLFLCELETGLSEIPEVQMDGIRYFYLQSKQQSMAERFQNYTIQVFEEIQNIFKDKSKGKVLLQIVVSTENHQQVFSGLSGLIKTARLENPKLIGQIIEVEPGETLAGIAAKIKENSCNQKDIGIRYQDGRRFVANWNEVKVSPEETSIPWKDQGVYLITGGAGGIGLIFAKEIAQKVKAPTLVLMGRSPLNQKKQTIVKEIKELGAQVVYKQVDVAHKKEVTDLVQNIQEVYKRLDGIIHSAGIIKDNFILKKTRQELQDVLAPKVSGLINLDEACKDLSLDFFVIFSAGAGIMGNVGQADYAAANAFMDAYAKYRNNLMTAKQRKGQTLVIDWPLWKEGGMHVDAETEKRMLQSMDLIAMRSESGIQALYQSIASGRVHVLVLEGNIAKIQQLLSVSQYKSDLKTEVEGSNLLEAEKKPISAIAQDTLQEKTIEYLKKLLSSVLSLPVNRIEAAAPMEKYGIDSIMVMQLTNQLEKTFGSLSKTLFYEYQDIQSLSEYFLESYRDQLIGLLEIGERVTPLAESLRDNRTEMEQVKPVLSSRRQQRFAFLCKENREEKANGALDIAIIGVSGRYPGAKNNEEFWKNLRDGKDCITEIPEERWDHSLYFDEDKNKFGKTYSKWGGFLEGVDRFDPLFFNISPRDAESIDPQERIFLECVYATMEDAGYTREAFRKYQGFSLEGNVGVYVGVMYEEYQLYGAQAQTLGFPIALTGSPSSIANRVSYFCNFHGPSVTVDTMCSSALTALHMACQSLQRGGCEVAFAGGVNVSIHPNKYLMLAQGKYASSKGRCESFGQGADGYVPGEGVGAVLLKPLSRAIADEDHIYGVIKTTAINHGGKTNGYSVPNPNAQAEVIGRALKEAMIDARTISYIEAHGTGTSLGDPIEITGLTRAFEGYTKDKQFCAIGSAKSNIGHCESAAGIAAVTKVLLQLKYGQLAPSLHTETLNPNIDFINTPFVVQSTLGEWKRPVIEINGESKEYPRIAGISSFGAGGSNAHIVIEEYISKIQERAPITITSQNPAIIVLSAKNEERLKEQTQQLLVAIKNRKFSGDDLADIAYTLQVGREVMEERMAMMVGSIEELVEKLQSVVENKDNIDNFYRGQVKRNNDTLAVFAADEDLKKAIDAWISKGKYSKLLDFWVTGLIFDWNKLYGDIKPRRISLPTYPFARDRYWIPGLESQSMGSIPVLDLKGSNQPLKTEKVILIKDWQPKPLAIKTEQTAGTIVVLGTTATQKLALELFKDTEGIDVLVAIHDNPPESDGIVTDFYSETAGTQLYRQLKERLSGGILLGVIDITAIDNAYEQSVELEAGKISFLQNLLANERNAGYKLLQITYQLNNIQTTKTTIHGARLAGLYRMLGAEYKQIEAMTMDSDYLLRQYKKLANQIQTEFLGHSQKNITECCYRSGERYEPRLIVGQTNEEILESQKSLKDKYTDQDVILITGGSRGIGAAIAEKVVSQGVRNLVIMGREDLPQQSEWEKVLENHEQPEYTAKVRRLQSYIDRGVKVRYYNTPLTDPDGLKAMVEIIHQEIGAITGVFHCAGLVSKNPAFIKKTIADMAAVNEPKVKGLTNLDQALETDPISFFILFSSISGIAPTLASGQSDYAMANSYMDYYAMKRCGEGKSYFKSIQWPAWRETGLAAEGLRTPAYMNTGLTAHTIAEGLAMLDTIRETVYTVSLPCVMIPDEFNAGELLKTELKSKGKKEIRFNSPEPGRRKYQGLTADGKSIRTTVIEWLRGIFIGELKLTTEQLNEDKPFDEYGVDSIILAQLAQTMQEKIGKTLDPSIILEHSTIALLADYFITNHGAELQRNLGIEIGKIEELIEDIAMKNQQYQEVTMDFISRAKPIRQTKILNRQEAVTEDIAVVGISCRLPGAPTKEVYWDLLTGGRRAIRPLINERWATYINRVDYGGWIEDIEMFDPKFFNITETDAMIMEPQARVLLEESLKAICDAGYQPKQLSGEKVGVYVGGRSQPNMNMEAISQADNVILGSGQNYLATNISRFFNFRGPSLVVDTACSSGITGMLFAADSLRDGRIDTALVGSVSLLLNPFAHEIFAARNILSKNGEFHIFDKRSGGEVLGEGVGVVILRRLSDAIRDGNQIYGVIKAIAINNDGRTLGPGSPNINAQKQVIEEALMLSGKQPEEIGYIEVNGGGSPVVDSVELKAVSDAYQLNNQALGRCLLGSIKPNIGHLLLTSGLAGFIRCILSVHHQQIPPFLSAIEPFKYYDFSASRIEFNRETVNWQVPPGQKRVAAQNSFPDGGTNCHVLVEEFIPDGSYQQRYFPGTIPHMLKKYFPVTSSALVASTSDQKIAPKKELLSTNIFWGELE